MDKTTIRALKSEIPLSQLGEIPNDLQIWESNDGGAHLKVTRHRLNSIGYEVFALTVSGAGSERRRVVREFSEVLGQPSEVDMSAVDDQAVWAFPGKG